MQYYNFETIFFTLAVRLGEYLKENGVYFEKSKANEWYHFEILTDASGAEKIENFIHSITTYDVEV